MQISRAELEAGSEERVCKGRHCGRVLNSANTLAHCLRPSPSPSLSRRPPKFATSGGCALLLAEFESATQKKKKKRKKVQPTQQTLLLSWILTFSFFCVFLSCSTLQFAKPFPSPEKFILFFKARRLHGFPTCHLCDCTTRASILRNGVLWGPKRCGARTACTWTCSLFAPVARALRLRAPPAQLSCSFYFPQSPAHSLEL